LCHVNIFTQRCKGKRRVRREGEGDEKRKRKGEMNEDEVEPGEGGSWARQRRQHRPGEQEGKREERTEKATYLLNIQLSDVVACTTSRYMLGLRLCPFSSALFFGSHSSG
jgi:hypothetical protein